MVAVLVDVVLGVVASLDGRVVKVADHFASD